MSGERSSNGADAAGCQQMMHLPRKEMTLADIASGVTAIGGAVGTSVALCTGAAAAVVCAPATLAAVGAVALVTKVISDRSERVAEISARKDVVTKLMDQMLAKRVEDNNHELKMTQMKVIKCGFADCGAKFDDDVQLTNHFKKFHTGFKCWKTGCGASFMDEEKLQQHLENAHSGFKCPTESCGATFMDPRKLSQHLRTCSD